MTRMRPSTANFSHATPDLSRSSLVVVTNTKHLDSILPQLLAQPAVAVDTEADSLFAYFHKVCLIQISIPGFDFIIDPLSRTLDARPLNALFASPNVQKVFHAAENDILILKRDYGFTFANLFDTLWAARVLGWADVGLGAILEKRFGVYPDKRMQRANWGKRPLTNAQLAYARLDTHFLLDLRSALFEELATRRRLAEAEEIFAGLPNVEFVAKSFDPDGFWNLRGARHLSGAQMTTLQAAYLWREEKARALDIPPFKVMNDQSLLAIAERRPTHVGQFREISGINHALLARCGLEFLDALDAASANLPPVEPKRNHVRTQPRPDAAMLARFEALRAWRSACAEKRRVDADVILTNETLMTIARLRPATLSDLGNCPGIGPIKRELYGAEILAVLQNFPNGQSH